MARPLEPELRGARQRLVEELAGKGIRDLAVLRAVEMTPRHLFVATGLRHRAYEDVPLPIGSGQTISQPWIHAKYLQALALQGRERVLEVGTGSGYQTALLARLTEQVFSIERVPALLQHAREILQKLDIRNVTLALGDGTVGWREFAPFDAILVGAGAPAVPQPLLEQLAEGGRLLIPIGERDEQQLMLYTRQGETTEGRQVAAVRFVPLIGSHGWAETGA